MNPQTPGANVVTVSGVERSFQVGSQRITVLKSIDMQIPYNRLIMLKGRSGSGKTTLMNIIGGLDIPNAGTVMLHTHAMHLLSDPQRTIIRRKEIGFIFQTYALMPLLTAWENVELTMRMSGVPRKQWKERIAYCLQKVGLSKRAQHRPSELSGGEQQRVAIAKAIAPRPRLLLADEPTAELDTLMGAQVMKTFRELIDEENMTICMTTHDPSILEVADHVYEMVDGTLSAS
jgi:putative ABC transport system ATP-binding protein